MEQKNEEGKGGKYLKKKNMLFAEERKSGVGKGGKYFLCGREGIAREYLDKEKLFFCAEEEKWRRKMRNIFGEGKYIIFGGEKNWEGKGGKYLEKENLYFLAKKKLEGKWG